MRTKVWLAEITQRTLLDLYSFALNVKNECFFDSWSLNANQYTISADHTFNLNYSIVINK